MTLADDYNIYIGSSTGSFKGVCYQKEKFTIRNIQNVKFTTNKVSVVALNWGNTDESEIIVAYSGQKIKVYDTDFKNFTTNTDVAFGEGDIVGISRYDECILTAVKSGDVKLWRYKSLDDQWTHFNVGKDLECMKHNKLNDIMASGGKENDLKLWDLNTTQNIFTAKNVKPDEYDLRKRVWVNDIQFLPNSDKVAVCSKYGYVRIFDPKLSNQRRPVINIEVPDIAYSTLATTNQSHYVLVGSTTGDMMAMDLRGKGKPCYKYKGFAGCIKDIVCTSNENLILSVSLDRHFRVHDFHSKKLLKKEYMQSRLTSILVRSDFSLDNITKNKQSEINDNDNNIENEEVHSKEINEYDKLEENEDCGNGDDNNVNGSDGNESDCEIIEVEEDNQEDSDNDDVEEEENGEEEESENEYYEESDDDSDERGEGSDEDEEEEDELFPLEKSMKRKLENSKEKENVKKIKNKNK